MLVSSMKSMKSSVATQAGLRGRPLPPRSGSHGDGGGNLPGTGRPPDRHLSRGAGAAVRRPGGPDLHLPGEGALLHLPAGGTPAPQCRRSAGHSGHPPAAGLEHTGGGRGPGTGPGPVARADGAGPPLPRSDPGWGPQPPVHGGPGQIGRAHV